MAERIVFNYEEMSAAASRIEEYSAEYKQAANAFKSAMETAVSSWEGESKNKFAALLEGSAYNYMSESIPQMVSGIASLLKKNAEIMKNADSEIAERIPDSI